MIRTQLISALCYFFLLMIPLSSISQPVPICPETTSKKAEKYYKDAVTARKNKKDYDAVIKLVNKSAEEDSSYADPWLLLGDYAYIKKDFKTMSNAYVKLIERCPDGYALPYYRLGKVYYEKGELNECIKTLNEFISFDYEKEELVRDANTMMYRAQLMNNPVEFNPVKLEGVSTSNPEYLPFISPDNEFCFFTRRFDEFPKGALTPRSVEKFMISSRQEDGNFDTGSPMPLPFNMSSSNNEGGPTITKDNRVLYFTYNDNGNFDLFYSEWSLKGWGPITNMGENVNDPLQWDSQPSVSADGNDLYFSTYRDTINETSDIYVTHKKNGVWGKAVPLPINTNGNEKTPYIHPDNRTLYFASDSLPGMGGYDIYVVRKNEKGNWGKPVNIGYPINTQADEVGFFISTDGRSGYFASNTLKGSSGYDIYQFNLPENAKPERVLFVKGDLRDSENNIPFAAKIELKNLNTQETMAVDYDSTTGKYASVVLFDSDYILTVQKDGHAYNSEYFSKEDSTISEPVTTNFELKQIEVGGTYKLNNIFFNTNSFELNHVSKNILLDFANFLNANPKVNVAIHGHTDNIGDADSNLQLSENRAKSVYSFLISIGIDKSRLSYKGFGQSKPIAENDSNTGRAQNRRTEFVILNK